MNVLVIGGGFSGAMTAAHLAAQGLTPTVIEPGELGRGVAYARTGLPLLLNTPSAMMSALPDDATHFQRYLARRGEPATFAPRATYGDYLDETSREVANGPIEVRRTRATSLERHDRGYTARCEDGRRVDADVCVLALGNAQPRLPCALEGRDDGYLHDPYRAIDAITADDDIAILGTGLTALDVVVGLQARGHRGRIVLVSRRGRLPEAHQLSRPIVPVVVPRELVRQPRLRSLVGWWRSQLEHGRSPASLVAGLRPKLSLVWRRLPVADRAGFARHLRPHWDVLRHRAPPAVRAIVDDRRADGSLEVLRGHLVEVERTAGGLRCYFAVDDADRAIDVRWLVNCTGPDRDVTRHASPLVQGLLARGMIEPDALGLGVATDERGAIVTRRGISPELFVVGPWRAADLWESTAVPELRVHARDVADVIAGIRNRGARDSSWWGAARADRHARPDDAVRR